MEHRKEGFSGLSAVCDQEEMKNTHLGIPEVTDCSSDTIPVGTESTAGTKKVQVPDLISMWKYLLNKNYANRRLSFYSNLNYMLKSGELSRIVGFKVLNRVINKEAMKLVNVDTHEALISREMFAEVQRIRAEAGKEAKAVRKKHFTPNMFIGKVFCAHCGRALHRQWAARKVMPDRYTYYCLTNSRYERGVCPGVCIEEQELRAIVTELLIRAINLELGKSVSELKKAASQDIGEVIRKEISSKHQELERNRKFLRGLFEHLVQHLITQEEYQSMKDDYDAKVSSLVGEIETLTKQQAQLQEKSEKSAGLKSDAEYLSTQRELTADLIGRLIEQIEIDHEHHVTVSYSFTDTFVEVRKP